MKYTETKTWAEINQTVDIFGKIYYGNNQVMSKLIEKIKSSNKTNFVVSARGSSNNAVTFFKYLLEVMTKFTVSLSAPSILTLYRGKIDYSNSIILGCSSSGLAEDVLEVVKRGKEQGAITIAITNDMQSPLAKTAEFSLNCFAGDVDSVVATKTFNCELFLLLWLASELANNKFNSILLKTLKAELTNILPQINELTTHFAVKLQNIKDGFVLSRGFSYPIALESALLLQETCYMHIKGYAGSEFMHGPLALVNSETPVIIYCSKFDGDEEIQSIIRADQIKCIEKVLSLNAPVYLITNDCIISGRFNQVNDALLNFSLPEEFASIVFSIFSQMLACKISCLIGNNPDKPRSLQKDIITK